MTHPKMRNPSLKISIDGQSYVLDFGDLGPLDATAFRAVTGTTLRSAIEEINATAGVDLDQLCGLAWLVARRDDPELAFATFVAPVTYETDVTLEAVHPDPEP